MVRREYPLSEDHVIEFYRGDAVALGDHESVGYLIKLANQMAEKLLEKGIYVIGFSYPVVPKGQARIRTQMSAAHTLEHVDKAVDAFIEVGRELGVIA